MVKDAKGLIAYIRSWLLMQARSSRSESFVVGLSGGVDSAVVYALCRGTGLPTYAVLMPCHSSQSSLERAREVLEVFGGSENSSVVNLEEAFYSVATKVNGLDRESVISGSGDKNGAFSALRSCLRAPTLDFVAKLNRGLVVGTGNRDEDEVTRYYQKRGDGAVDISPIAGLHKSEVYELARELGVPESVLNAKPSADLLGPDSGQSDEASLGMTYEQIEKATRMVGSLYGKTSGDAFLHLARALDRAGAGKDEFVQVLKDLGTMEMASKHKHNPNLPVCNVRDSGTGFVD